MNFRIIAYIVGWVCNFQAAFMLLPFFTALIYHEREFSSFLIAMAVCLVIGIPLTLKKPKNKVFYTKDGCVAVALSWVALCVFGALPFVVSGYIPHPVDALFETVSGFTTTGSSILTDVEVLPHCVLIWRSFTHWIGGMGVLVFLLSLLPLTGGYHMNLMKAESPGPSVSKLVPKVQSTAKILYTIYFGMTLAQIVLLLIGKVPLFDTLCITFGTAGTGGFGIVNDSIGSYSTYCQVVTTIFMILFGVNFSVYYLILTKKFRQAFKYEEVRYYFGIIIASILIITFNTVHLFRNVLVAFQQVAFQVASIITTTGFSSTDFNQWPALSKTVLVLLMFVGACAGSTGGGFKVSRLMIVFRAVKNEIQSVTHPRSVQKVHMDGRRIPDNVVKTVLCYLAGYVVILIVSVLLISLDNFDMTTNFTAVMATFNNVGPGLNRVGPTGNFGGFSVLSKLVLMFDMLVGRLELYPMLVIFAPGLWRIHPHRHVGKVQ
mgnify:CR=1 FL=1